MAKSSKKAEASRKNGAKSKGPKTKEGKSQSSQNSIQDGIFARQIVIAHLGERQKTFDDVKKQLFETLRPSNILEEMLVMDFVENWWRRERIRRAEAIELRNRSETAKLRAKVDAEGQVQDLKEDLLLLIRQFEAASPGKDRVDLQRQLERVRQQLSSTSLGLRSLLDILETVTQRARENGVISSKDTVTVLACMGFENRNARFCLGWNEINRAVFEPGEQKPRPTGGVPQADNWSERDKELLKIARSLLRPTDKYGPKKSKGQGDNLPGSAQASASPTSAAPTPHKKSEPPDVAPEGLYADEVADDIDEVDEEKRAKLLEALRIDFESNKNDKSTRDSLRNILVQRVEACRRELIAKELDITRLEETQAVVAPWLALIDPTTSDRFSRAEAAVERRMYRALAALAAMRSQDTPNLLPDVGSGNQK